MLLLPPPHTRVQSHSLETPSLDRKSARARVCTCECMQHLHVSIWLTNEAGLPIDCGPLSSSCDQAQFAPHKYAGRMLRSRCSAHLCQQAFKTAKLALFAPLDADEQRFCEMAGEKVRCLSQSSVVRVSLPFQYLRKTSRFLGFFFFLFWDDFVYFNKINPIVEIISECNCRAAIGAFYSSIKRWQMKPNSNLKYQY